MSRSPRHAAAHDPKVAHAAGYGARYWFERNSSFGASLLTDVEWQALGTYAVSHALATTLIVDRAEMEEAVARQRERADQQLRRACAAENARDRALVAVQVTLHQLANEHPALRGALAEAATTCGVIFDPEAD